jgi:hypothetical protein
MSFDDSEFRKSVEYIRNSNEETFQNQKRDLQDWAKTGNKGALYMILNRLISDTNYFNKFLLDNNTRTIIFVDEIISLQKRIAEFEGVQEQENQARIQQKKETAEFKEIAEGIKTIMKDRAENLERQKGQGKDNKDEKEKTDNSKIG